MRDGAQSEKRTGALSRFRGVRSECRNIALAENFETWAVRHEASAAVVYSDKCGGIAEASCLPDIVSDKDDGVPGFEAEDEVFDCLRILRGSSALVGSSIRMTSGFVARARARQSRCC